MSSKDKEELAKVKSVCGGWEDTASLSQKPQKMLQ